MKIKTTSLLILGALFFIVLIANITNYKYYSLSQETHQLWNDFDHYRNNKLSALANLRNTIGFVGMIKEYKNYI